MEQLYAGPLTWTSDWIVLTVFHSFWISALGFLLLGLCKPKSPPVISTWCFSVLLVLFLLPSATRLIPRIELPAAASQPAESSVEPPTAPAPVVTTAIPQPKPGLLLNQMLDIQIPLTEHQARPWTMIIQGFGILWMSLGLYFLLRVLYEFVHLQGFCSGLEEINDPRIDTLLEEMTSYYRFRREPRFFISTKPTSPISVGIRQPLVIFPKSLYQTIRPEELRAILLHELAHIAHYDHVLALFQRILKAIYWWNPFVYCLCNRLSVAREEVSDNYAISGMKNASAYAMLLMELVEKTCLMSRLPAAAGMANPYIKMETRIKNLISKERNMSMKTNKKTRLMMVLTVILFCGLITVGSQVQIFGGESSIQARNLTAEVDGWIKRGSRPQDYEISQDTTIFHSSPSSCRLTSISESISGFGTILDHMDAQDFLGQRVRMSAYIKAENVTDWAGMWMRVDGENRRSLAFDNMQNRPIQGTLDWQHYEIVLDVPEQAKQIVFGVLLSDTGTVWADEVEFETVSTQTPLTSSGYAQTGSWFKAGSHPGDYEIGKDSDVYYSEPSSDCLASISDTIPGFGTIMNNMSPEDYHGKRIRLSARIKAENVESWAGLWMRVDGKKAGKPLAFDNMQNRAIEGTCNWQLYEVVLDVSEEAGNIAFGVLLAGTGRVWVDEVLFEAVDEQTPTTDLIQTLER